jgi:hypothetical protein
LNCVFKAGPYPDVGTHPKAHELVKVFEFDMGELPRRCHDHAVPWPDVT